MKTSSSAAGKPQGQKDSNGGLSLNKKRLGFTLAELIVVITILAILSTIGFLALSGYRNDAKDAVIQANIRSIYTAINAEAASTSTSARCFIVHSSEYTLTGGAVVALDSGASDTLRGGPCGSPNTNYSAGNPDYAKLKLDPEKFRISLLSSPKSQLIGAIFPKNSVNADDYVADPGLILVGSADLVDTSGSKPRTRSFTQVAGVLTSSTVYVTGDFTAGDDESAVVGLIRDAAYTESSTWALVNGAEMGAPAPCAEQELSGYQISALSSGQNADVEKTIDHGKGVAKARCSYGTVRLIEESAQCDEKYIPGSPVPSCVFDNCTGQGFEVANQYSWAVTNGEAVSWSWQYSAEPGNCKFACAEGFSWDGSICRQDCSTGNVAVHSGLSYAIPLSLPVRHGENVSSTGTHVFGTDPVLGELIANFAFTCENGTLGTASSNGNAACPDYHLWNDSWTAPVCAAQNIQFNQYVFSETIGWTKLNLDVLGPTVTGYAESENIGWICFSNSCGANVTRNAITGKLSGYALSEMFWWIDVGNVYLNGNLSVSGYAQSEMLGWIKF